MRCLNLNVLAKLCDSVIWASSVLSQSAPWKFSEWVYTILSFCITVFTCNLPQIPSFCWSKTHCCFQPLLQRVVLSVPADLSLQAGDEWLQDSSGSFAFLDSSFLGNFLCQKGSPLMPMYLRVLAPSLTQC